jgi:PTH1 family peptidyl-tRNA hydrolase
MKLIVGLGNPGKKFAKTRHNTGHIFVSAYGKQLTANGKAVCRKTSVFVNNSGEEIKKLTTDYRLPTTDLLIVHDDMDLPLGEFKLQSGRSAAGHKGVQSIIEELGTQDFWRLRVGIGRPPSGTSSEDYVLAPFSKGEINQLEAAFEAAEPAISEWSSSEI